MKKNLVKKAVLPALAALLCSAIALTSVSYAWFTMGTAADVEEMQLQVTTSDGLQVSAVGDVGTYKSHISLTDLGATGLNNQFPLSGVKPVSTDGSVVDGVQNMFLGTVNDGKLTATDASTDYIVFDLYIQSSTTYNLLLNKDSYVVSAESGDETHLAARVSFVDLGCAATASAAQGLTGPTGKATIWEPNFKERAQSVKNNGVASDSTAPLAYNGLKEKFDNGVALNDTSHTSAVTVVAPAYNSNGNTTETAKLFQLEAGYNRIRVYVWLEGQDVDCVNEIAAGTLKIKLNFTVAAPEAQ